MQKTVHFTGLGFLHYQSACIPPHAAHERMLSRLSRDLLRPVLRSTAQVSSMSAPASAQESARSLYKNIITTYERARENGAAYKTDTHTEVYKDDLHGIEFVLRVAAALRDKPRPAKESGEKNKKGNPFLPYEEALWVRHLSPTHTLLLNKFNVVAHHLICVTREFEQQTQPLTAADFEATWAAMQAFPNGALAYFNCGEEAGASQPHKHTQIVPLPLGEGSSSTGTPFESVLRKAHSQSGAQEMQSFPVCSLPYESYAAVLSARPSGAMLEDTFKQLKRAFQIREYRESSQHIPYNVVLTSDYMTVVPRSKERCGPVSVNSMGYAGSLFVRSQAELDYIKEQGPMRILAEVGLPW